MCVRVCDSFSTRHSLDDRQIPADRVVARLVSSLSFFLFFSPLLPFSFVLRSYFLLRSFACRASARPTDFRVSATFCRSCASRTCSNGNAATGNEHDTIVDSSNNLRRKSRYLSSRNWDDCVAREWKSLGKSGCKSLRNKRRYFDTFVRMVLSVRVRASLVI